MSSWKEIVESHQADEQNRNGEVLESLEVKASLEGIKDQLWEGFGNVEESKDVNGILNGYILIFIYPAVASRTITVHEIGSADSQSTEPYLSSEFTCIQISIAKGSVIDPTSRVIRVASSYQRQAHYLSPEGKVNWFIDFDEDARKRFEGVLVEDFQNRVRDGGLPAQLQASGEARIRRAFLPPPFSSFWKMISEGKR